MGTGRPHIWRALAMCAIAACLGPAGISPAQRERDATASSQPSSEDASRTAVLSFVAFDHDGQPIVGLKPAELSLQVDNQSCKILSLVPTGDGPRAIGVFFDVSSSSRFDKAISKEVEATSNFLQSTWRNGDSGFVVIFDDSLYAIATPTVDLQQIQTALKTIPMETPHGGTALYDALRSIAFGPDRGARERVFLVVSDLKDNSSHISRKKTIQILKEEGVRVIVFLRVLTGHDYQQTTSGDKQAAKELAEKTGGDLFVLMNQAELDAAFHRLAGELQGGYRVTYELPSGAGTSRTRELMTSRPGVDLLYAE